MKVYAAYGENSREEAKNLLTLGAREVWGLGELPEITRTPAGKPYFPCRPDKHFNLSHSGPYALCALGESPLGVDIQIVKDTWRSGLPRRVCSPAELRWLEGQPDFWGGFTALWAMKEARVKYTGTGLRVPVREISVPLPGKEGLYEWDGLWFRLWMGEGWRCALCAETPPPPEIIWV